jgi:predicted DCC family thiol-disulfide oxidoreductase YuxK
MPSAIRPSSARPLLLFDGVCGLCNTGVDWVMRHDRRRLFRFAPLQSPAGQAALRESGLSERYFDSIVLIAGRQVYTRSTAALHVARQLGWPWKALFGLVLVPRILRDLVYDFIAKHRYEWFGKRDACRIPTPEERQQLIFELEAA